MKNLVAKYGYCWVLIFISCTTGSLHLIYSLPNKLEEISAAEIVNGHNHLWMIEDQGNAPKIYGLDLTNTNELKTTTITNAENKDWEDLTSDKKGNLYIGDFGNNSGKRKESIIYKLNVDSLEKNEVLAETIIYSLPKSIQKDDFESFFLFKNYFYIFSKNKKEGTLIKVPNSIGVQEAEIVTNFNLKGKNNDITSADISEDGNQVVLLNHDKVWVLSNFKGDEFFSGTIKSLSFKHKTQKEGICFFKNNEVIINDERNGSEGGNVYSFNLN